MIMGTELSKVNIKENSLIVQLQELKSYMITKLDARFKQAERSKMMSINHHKISHFPGFTSKPNDLEASLIFL